MPVVYQRTTYYDTDTPELGLMVQPHPSPRKCFFWCRRVQGGPRYINIGDANRTKIEEARAKAKEYSVKLEAWKRANYAGPDPLRDTPSGEVTLETLFEEYVTKHVLAHAKKPERAADGVRWMFNRYLSRWKRRTLTAVHRTAIKELHTDLAKESGEVTANRVVQLLRRLFNYAKAQELFTGENPTEGVRMYHEHRRTRFVQKEEMSRLFAALKQEPNPDLVDYVCLALWTGQRKSDILSMRWQDLSLDDNRWTVPEPKNRVPFVAPLTNEAVKILRRRKRLEDNPWVFPSHGKTGHLIDLKKRWQELLKRAHITNLTQHDLRRTFGSWLAAKGVSLPMIGKLLGHRSLVSTQIYSQLDLEGVRDAANSATAAMQEAAKPPKQLKR
jgi:integrase